MDVVNRIEGVVIGLLIGFEDGAPLVVFVGNPKETAVAARSLAALDPGAVGSEVALLFEGGDPSRPLIVGRIVEPVCEKRREEPEAESATKVVSAAERVELRCGLASIIMEKDGRVSIRGTQVSSHASRTNRIRGGAVHLN